MNSQFHSDILSPEMPQLSRWLMRVALVLLMAFCSSFTRADDHGNSFASATTVAAENPSLRDFQGMLETSDDQDFFRFDVTKETILWLYTTGSTDTSLTLYNANGTWRASNNGSGAASNAHLYQDASRRLPPGTYYVLVTGGGNYGQAQTGSYRLSIRTQGNAHAVTQSNVADSLDVEGALDFYRFDLTEETILWLYTTGATDTSISLYNANGTWRASDNGSGAGNNAHVFQNSSAKLSPGEYYVLVEGGGNYGQAQTGPYTLSLRTQSGAMPFNTPNLAASLGVAGDIDVFRLDVHRRTFLCLYTTGETDTDLELYHSNGTRIESDNESGNDSNAHIWLGSSKVLEQGTYYVTVRAGGVYGKAQTGDYTLSVRMVENAMSFNGWSVNRSLETGGDLDLHRVVVERPGPVSFFTTGGTDTQLELFTESGVQISYSDNESGAGANALLHWVNLERGTYYLFVSAGGVYGQSQTGPYVLHQRLPGNAEPILSNTTIARSIGNYGDLDCYVFTTAGGDIDFHTTGITNTACRLVGSNGAQLAFDDNSGLGGINCQIKGSLPKGTYYLYISGSDADRDKGKYKLVARFPAGKTTRPAFDSVVVGSNAQSITLPVTSNTSWKASETLSWVSLSPSSSKGNGTVTIKFSRNAGSERTGTIKAGGVFVRIIQLGASPVSPADWNGDSTSDLLVRNSSTGQSAVWFMDHGNVTHESALPLLARSHEWKLVGQADFDGNGSPDLLEQNRSTGALRIQFITGAEVATEVHLDRKPDSTDWIARAVGDFSKTGIPEIVLQNKVSGKLMLWRVEAKTSAKRIQARVSWTGNFNHQPSGAAWQVVGAGDTTGDGSPDLIFQHQNGQIHLWILNGHEVIASGALTCQPTSTAWKVVAIGDQNHDGCADLVIQNSSANEARIWFLKGRVVLSGGVRSLSPGWRIAGGIED